VAGACYGSAGQQYDRFEEVCVTVREFQHSLFVILAIAGLSPAPALAQETALPGGATSLREVHGDWVVSCVIRGEGEQARKVCAMSQEQQNGQSGQRIIAVELQPSADASAATLFLPFGLDLASGAALQIDDQAQGQPLPFRTCLPAGCIVSSNLDAKMLESLRNGTSLKVHAKADGAKDTMFSVSLKGFGGAFDRTLALAK
jgi:invasion protein IalB